MKPRIVILAVLCAWPAWAVAGTPSAPEQVRAVLTAKCLTCHASDSKKGGLDLTRRASALVGGESGPAVVPGKPDESLLWEKLQAGEMPPKNPLNAEQLEAFRAWIEAGALYAEEPLAARRAGPDWWSLRPIGRPAIPHEPGGRTPVDAFIAATRRAQHLEPSPEADRATMIRRARFDLTGLPPSPEEVEAFVNDPDAHAYEKLVDRLLASPQYGERWGRHWLDVVRFGESEGYEMNHLRPNAWLYRDYVIRAFNRDTPLPQFAREQLAGDTLADGDALTQAATGFLVGGTHDQVGNATVEGMLQQRVDDLDDMLTATSSAFLGLTVNCARCHDHKFDPITQKDYYALQAVFAGVQHAERPIREPESAARRSAIAEVSAALRALDRKLADHEPIARPDLGAPGRPMVNFQRNVDRFAPVAARFVRFTVLATNNQSEPCLDELEIWTAGPDPKNVARAGKPSASSEYAGDPKHQISHLNDGRYGNARSWISRVPGKGWAQVELPQVETIDRVVWARDREERFQDRLPTEYLIETARAPGEWRVVASSADRVSWSPTAVKPSGTIPDDGSEEARVLLQEQRRLRAKLATLESSRTAYAGTFMTPGPTRLLRRGDPMQAGETVAPASPSAVAPALTLPADTPESARREALTRWLGDPANPLPARVMVNRVWHYHFGRGLVATPSDFGFNGARPTHSELLDWLAREYLQNGFHLKPIHRLILLSSTYRQSSQSNAPALEIDRDNQYLWRFAPRRLEAEPIRDAILSASGRLDRRMGGPGYDLWEENTNYVHVYNPKLALGPAELRRMVYQFRPRSQQDPTFGAFDCPDSALVAPRRTASTTALQALNLFNSEFMMAQSDAFATRLKAECGDDLANQARRGFRLAFGRVPTEPERNAAVALIREHGTRAFCRALYNANEFVYVP